MVTFASMRKQDLDIIPKMNVKPPQIQVVADNGSKSHEEETTLTQSLNGAKRPGIWQENQYMPTAPEKLRSPEHKIAFLVLLHKHKYIILAAEAFGVSRRTVTRVMADDPDFAAAAYDVLARREERKLAEIEAVSEAQAIKPGAVTDRAMQLNALDPGKYKRDAKGGVQTATQINIVLGFEPPHPPQAPK